MPSPPKTPKPSTDSAAPAAAPATPTALPGMEGLLALLEGRAQELLAPIRAELKELGQRLDDLEAAPVVRRDDEGLLAMRREVTAITDRLASFTELPEVAAGEPEGASLTILRELQRLTDTVTALRLDLAQQARPPAPAVTAAAGATASPAAPAVTAAAPMPAAPVGSGWSHPVPVGTPAAPPPSVVEAAPAPAPAIGAPTAPVAGGPTAAPALEDIVRAVIAAMQGQPTAQPTAGGFSVQTAAPQPAAPPLLPPAPPPGAAAPAAGWKVG